MLDINAAVARVHIIHIIIKHSLYYDQKPHVKKKKKTVSVLQLKFDTTTNSRLVSVCHSQFTFL